jgi:hypothetical protein
MSANTQLVKAAAARVVAVDAPAPPTGIINRIEAALQRIENGHGIRRIPADPTDPDLVLAECKAFFEGRTPPFWVKAEGGAA